MELWVVTETNTETGASEKWFYETEEEAEQYAKEVSKVANWSAEVTKFYSEDHVDGGMESEIEEWKSKYDDLLTEVDGLRTALNDAKAESERRINEVSEALRVARSDIHTREEVIVKLAMRLVGM